MYNAIVYNDKNEIQFVQEFKTLVPALKFKRNSLLLGYKKVEIKKR